MTRTPKFARRHYRAVAAAIKEEPTFGTLIDRFVATFKADNPRFDERRFRDACAPEPGFVVTAAGKKALLRRGT